MGRKVMKKTCSWMDCLRCHQAPLRYQRWLRRRVNMRNMVCVETESAKQTNFGVDGALVRAFSVTVDVVLFR